MVYPVMSHFLRPMSLKLRVLLLVSALIVAGIWGLALRVAAVLQNDLEKGIAEHLSATVGYVGADLDKKIQFRMDALNKIAAAITPAMLVDPLAVQHFLEQRYLSSSLFALGIFAANNRGIAIADFPRLPGRKGGFVGDRDYFLEVMAGGKEVIGRPIEGRLTKRPIVVVAVPLRDAFGAIVGVLGGTFSISDMSLFGPLELTKVGKSGYFLVSSPKHKVFVSASDNNRILTPEPPRGFDPLLDRRRDEGYEGPGIHVNSLGQEVLSVSHNMKTTGWITIAGILTDEAFAPIRTIKRQIYVSAFVISLAVALVLSFVLKRQMAPIDEASRAMRRMSDGETAFAAIPVKGDDEIGRLLGNFNRLVDERRRAEEEVRDLNHHLERRVSDRTNELLLANQNLEDEIAERKRAESKALDLSTRVQAMTRRFMCEQEIERRRLARELHDRVSSSLMAIGLNIDLVKRKLAPEVAASVSERLSDTADLLRETMLSSREISSDLHPASLDYDGIVSAVEDYGKEFAGRTGIAVEVKGNCRELRFPPDKESALFRIAQEALMNCAKHADARHVTIELSCDAGHAMLTIEDDGAGFDLSSRGDPLRCSGLGLLSMKERAEAFGGTFRIESSPETGTVITVDV